MNSRGLIRSTRPASLAFTLVSVVLGLAVLLGWHGSMPSLVQVHPSFAPMQYNTALGFVICGLGLVFLLFKRPWGGRICAVLAMSIGGLTLLEYGGEFDLGIDELFMEHNITVQTSHPGRMAPNTALEFVLSGLTLVLAIEGRAWRGGAVGVLGALILALAAVALFGYLTAIETAYGWGELTRMAVHTAVGFGCLGLSLLALAWDLSRSDPSDRRPFPPWAIAATGVGSGALALAVCVAVNAEQTASLQRRLDETGTELSRAIQKRLASRVEALARMGARWERRGGTPRSEWEMDARSYVRDQAGYQAIVRVDAKDRIHWVAAPHHKAATLGLEGIIKRHRKTALLRARDSRKAALSGTFELARGGTGFFIAVPLFADGVFDGYILGFHESRRLLELEARGTSEFGYQVSVFAGDKPVYGARSADSRSASESLLEYDGLAWRIRVQAGEAAGAQPRRGLPILVLFIGLLLALLLVFSLRSINDLSVKRDEIAAEVEERRRAEELLARHRDELDRIVAERTASLEAANKELEAYTYSVSHDLRAPIRHMNGFLNLLRRRSEADLDERSLHYLDVIGQASKRLVNLIDDLLAFSRAGLVELKVSEVDLAAMVRDLKSELTSDQSDRAVEWRLADLPTIEADPRLLRQVFQNLLDNALKYSRDSDPAIVEIGVSGEDDAELVLFVRDNGVGFSMEHADRLFGVFQRLHRRADFDGTGIGLANVSRFVRKHGGRVWAESAPGEGATFYVALPKTRPA